MFAKLLQPHVDMTALILRIGLAAIFVVHGYFKVIQHVPLIPEFSTHSQVLYGWAELICGTALLFGLLSRLAALGIIVLQAAAIVLVTGKWALAGLEMTSAGADFRRVGPEYNFVLIAMALGVILLGPGVVSLDHCISRLLRGKQTSATPALAQKASPEPVLAGSASGPGTMP
jgi:putative oxidoreductase